VQPCVGEELELEPALALVATAETEGETDIAGGERDAAAV
jgi:hypothetical protein